MLDDIDELRTFVRIVAAGSLSAAGREMNLALSVVSKRLASLERRTDTRLVARSTRRLALTEEGQRLYRHAQRILAEIAEAEEALSHGRVEPQGILRVGAPAALGRMHVGWAWRHEALERGTHELSTKLLEYASACVPPIMAGNAVNVSVFGESYPLYADTPEQAIALLARLASDASLRLAAAEAAHAAAARFDFAAVREFLRAQGLVPCDDRQATFPPHEPKVST